MEADLNCERSEGGFLKRGRSDSSHLLHSNDFDSVREVSVRIHRSCQASVTLSRKQSIGKEHGTQMTRKRVYVSNANDVYRHANSTYQLADDLDIEKEKKIVKIQCCVRIYLAKRKVEHLRILRDKAAKAIEFDHQTKAYNMKIRSELCALRVHNPQTLADVEQNKIDWACMFRDTLSSLPYSEKKRYITSAVREHNKVKPRSVSVPKYRSKLWLINDEIIEVVNEQESIKYTLLNRLVSDIESTESRLELNQTLRKLLKYSEKGIQDLQYVLIRENEQLRLNRPISAMKGLRCRIYRLWLEYIQTSL